jgi:integrase
MTQVDISDLRHEEVDWKAGRIIRKRSKTKDHDNVPTVNYPLWPSTLELLKKHKSSDPERVIVNRSGGPLKAEALQAGKFSKRDAIGSAFLRLCEEASIEGLTFKHLRKTGASTLRKHRDYKTYDWIYLGHSPRNIAERHYSEESQDLFDEAIRWLGKQFEQS